MSNSPQDKTLCQAVALRYDETKDRAPKVVAKGSGLVADRIIEAAKANAVPVYQSQTLNSVLMAVELDQEIPAELYAAVAEVLAYIYKVDQFKSKRT